MPHTSTMDECYVNLSQLNKLKKKNVAEETQAEDVVQFESIYTWVVWIFLKMK